MAPVLWLGIYLVIGVAALWACQSSSACRLHARLDRNQTIVSGLGALFGHSPAVRPHAGAANDSAR